MQKHTTLSTLPPPQFSYPGYYTFEECGDDWINPTIGVEVGQVYTFIQKDRSNFLHPLDFSYFPDAVHLGEDLLDPRNNPTKDGSTSQGEGCDITMTCPSPMYFLNDGYLGTYSNIPELVPVTVNESDIGLAVYEDLFHQEMPSWVGLGTFSIKLKFDDESYTSNDLFYYCRVHQYMAGRIKLLKNGEPVNIKDTPPLYYTLETPGEFDKQCGTFGLDPYQLPHPQCPYNFVCDVDDRMRGFANCIEAMDCHMMIGMTTKVTAKSEVALFVHQMIPHHQNAVNMARALLHAGFLPCDDLTNTEDPYCIMQSLLYSIVAGQNHEIGIMSQILSRLNYPLTDECEVLVSGQEADQPSGSDAALSGMATVTAACAIWGAIAAQAF